jgi:Helicase conserved C-terminal domain
VTLIATSAVELGVDIEGLDICVIDQLPPARQDLLQRIGRVSRRDGQPGLVVLSASVSPQDRRILSKPLEAFRLDTTATLPLPTDVEMLRWRHMIAAHKEGVYRLYACGDWQKFARAMEKYFGECRDFEVLKSRFEESYGNVVDMEGKYWAHNGFRASASQGKIPLIEFGGFGCGLPAASEARWWPAK